ncbi:MAG TPA: L-fucose/L-arabinose isomerase family protein [Aggregatilinea sp.]|jgi:L-fucose isomerase-like protein|uniref:L-fucose/L-arabinose isomerase family protein n=1 Tax=Aggregatilinea sp. TaxID=2806333 RepID=UPI002B5CA4C0|nr:L-fucose/L-arabinose isomerase family protein [Aggregatilinea sp.]HML21591.1 L-fucose/L-arabinose isomerase family protein [Aggregatilinea sp.]
MKNGKMCLAVIVGNRDFFPDRLVTEGRQDILALFAEMDIEPVILNENATKLGAVETWEHAKECAALFRQHREEIDGVLVTLPNFGDERGVADTIKLSGLNVPILVQAYPDDLGQFTVERRRDAYCGKISVCNNLVQYGYPFSLTERHTIRPNSDSFRRDLKKFVSVCRVVNGLRTARLGAIGARPGNFNTTRFSEKLLQASGISVTTLDLSEVFGWAGKLANDDARVQERLDAIRAYVPTGGVPSEAVVRQAKLAVVIGDWMAANDLDATAIQCWNSIQQNYGVNVCTVMSMMSEGLMPSACEVDITGTVSMYALQLASGQPSALVDWNNNYADDPDKCVLFHCGNWAKSFFGDVQMANAEILATTLGTENTYGTVAGRTPSGPFSYARLTTDDTHGRIRTYVGDGQYVDDPLDTFGSRAVVEVPGLQKLMQYVCRNGFEHHAAMNASHSADVLAEAFEIYFGWDVYHHEG